LSKCREISGIAKMPRRQRDIAKHYNGQGRNSTRPTTDSGYHNGIHRHPGIAGTYTDYGQVVLAGM